MNRGHPGWINAHTHIYAGLASWLPQRSPAGAGDFVDGKRLGWWRLVGALDGESLRIAARTYVAESLLAGTTALIDHHESPAFIEGSLDVIADACQELGMRAVLCYAASERNGGRDEARRGLAECRRFIESNERPLVRGVVGLHASFTVSDETIREAGRLALRLGTVVHVEVAEDEHDVRDAITRGYGSPFSRLASLGALPPASIVAGGVRLSAEAVQAAAERELWLVQCPSSNERFEVGYPQGLAYSHRVAIGSDGAPSNPLDEFEALLRTAGDREESMERVGERFRSAERLIEERFGLGREHRAVVGLGEIRIGEREVVSAGELTAASIDDIRAGAAEAEQRLRAGIDAA